MATTTNFGWETPDDTDLVKDGAAAIRTALGGVDTSFVDLKGGTTGQALTKASGTDLDFTWTSPASGGKILQVIQATYGTSTTNATITFADTGLSATITPSSTSSRVLCMVFHPIRKTSGSNQNAVRFRLVRTSTTIHTSADNLKNSAAAECDGSYAISYVDSPATTSATTYKTTFSNATNSADAVVQVDGRQSVLILMEIGA